MFASLNVVMHVVRKVGECIDDASLSMNWKIMTVYPLKIFSVSQLESKLLLFVLGMYQHLWMQVSYWQSLEEGHNITVLMLLVLLQLLSQESLSGFVKSVVD